ncbi:MAG: O-antigen ligase family protein [Candidatus Daviesbacteria bacterium]|nr:O-antigen ligase family protein [Candidatus Daviesbacteria bacterium]
MTLLVPILAFALTSGQLIRLPFLGGGVTLLDLTVAVLSVYGLIKLKLKLKNPPFLKPALCFILIALFSLLLTPLRLTLPEYLVSFSYIARLFLYVLFGWVVYSGSFLDTRKAFLLSGMSFAVLGLLQFAFFPDLYFLKLAGWDPHYFRTVSTFLDPNFAGAFLVLTMILSFKEKNKKISIFIFALLYIALFTTFSRSSYLMFLVSGLTFFFLNKSKKYLLLTLVLFAFLLFGFQIYSKLVAAPRNINREQSASFRLNTWQQGLDLFKKSPVLGIGFNAYRYGIKKYNLGDQQFLDSHGSSGNDSSLLFVASTTGIIGFLVYLYFLFSLMKSSKIITAAILGLIVHSFFSNSLFYPPILAWILIMSVVPKK